MNAKEQLKKLIAKYKERLAVLRDNQKYNKPNNPEDNYPYDWDIHNTQGFIRDLKKLEEKGDK